LLTVPYHYTAITPFTVKGKKSTSMIEPRGELLCRSAGW